MASAIDGSDERQVAHPQRVPGAQVRPAEATPPLLRRHWRSTSVASSRRGFTLSPCAAFTRAGPQATELVALLDRQAILLLAGKGLLARFRQLDGFRAELGRPLWGVVPSGNSLLRLLVSQPQGSVKPSQAQTCTDPCITPSSWTMTRSTGAFWAPVLGLWSRNCLSDRWNRPTLGDRGMYCMGTPCSCTKRRRSWERYRPYCDCLSSTSRTFGRSRKSFRGLPGMESRPRNSSLYCRSTLLLRRGRSCRFQYARIRRCPWDPLQTPWKLQMGARVLQSPRALESDCASLSLSCCSPSNYLGSLYETARRTCRDRGR